MNKCKAIIVFLFLQIIGCTSISQKSSPDEIIDYTANKIATGILEKYKVQDKKIVGVAAFTTERLEDKEISLLGLYLANSIHNEMFNPDRFQLVERENIDRIISEYKLYQTGLFDKEKNKLGLLGVDYLLIGSLQKRENSIRVNSRLVSVQTGNIVSIASQLIPLNKGILDLFQKVKKENGKVGYDSEVKILRKTYSGYQKPKKYLLDDEVVLTYHHSNKFGTAKVGLMKRSCNENSVEFIRFLDVKEDSKELIFPFESTISLRNLLSDYGNVKMDDSGCYELSLMVEGKKMKNTLISIEPGARKDVLED